MKKDFKKFSKKGKFSPKQKDSVKVDESKEKAIPAEGSKDLGNDFKWYLPDEQIGKDVASIPFNYMGGTNFNTDVKIIDVAGNTTVNTKKPLPSIQLLTYVPSIGVTTKKTDGINMAAVQMYTFIRHANSGARNYEAADAMLYVLGASDIYANIGEAKRALGTAAAFTYFNHNMPDLLVHALGYNPTDLRANIAQYRGRLNLLIEKMNSFAVPKYFQAFLRRAYVSNYVFADSSSIRGQFYVFRKAGYYTWETTTSETGTELQYHELPSAGNYQTFGSFLDAIEAQINKLYLDTDALTISGDILKAFGEGGCYTIPMIDENYKVLPVFDENILAQIENATVVPGETADYTPRGLDITQSGQLLQFQPEFVKTAVPEGQSGRPQFGNRIFNSHKDNPDYRDVVEWSRLMSTFEYKFENWENQTCDVVAKVLSTGSEMITRIDIFQYTETGAVYNRRIATQISLEGSVPTEVIMMGDIQQFDWHPIVYLVNHLPDHDVHFGADLKVATLIDNDTIKRINDCANYSLYYNKSLY